jgi:hypothetical protein
MKQERRKVRTFRAKSDQNMLKSSRVKKKDMNLTQKGKKDEVHPRTGHEGPDVE